VPTRGKIARCACAALIVVLALLAGLAACTPNRPVLRGIHKIRHVVVIMQENRSFDSYFGTYPGADGIPAKNGHFTVCVPNPRARRCDRPYHDPNLVNGGASTP
jgi:phospholipase C